MTDEEKQLLKDRSTNCARCKKKFDEGETKCLKRLDSRSSHEDDTSSYAVLCRDCNFIMYNAEKELKLKTDKIITSAKKTLTPLMELILNELVNAEANAIVSYSKNITSSCRPTLDKLYCGVHRWKTCDDLAKLLEIANWLEIEKVDSKHKACEIKKQGN